MLRLWDPNNGVNFAVLRGHTDEIDSLTWSPDGQHFASSSEDTTIRLWRINTSPSPKIVFESQKIYDSGPLVGWSRGNSNGVIEAGERIEFTVTLKNDGTDTANNVNGILLTKDSSVRITDALVNYGNIGSGSFGPSLFPLGNLSEHSFKIEVQDSATAHDVTFTLNITADNGGPWTISITLSIVNSSEIRLVLPDDLISEEAFGPHSTYFTLTAKYPTLTGISDAEVSYDDCAIILHIPEGTQAFMFPIRTRGEQAEDLVKAIVIYIGNQFLGVSDLIALLEFFARFSDLLKRDLKIKLPKLLGSAPGRPNKEIDFVVLLKNETRTPASLDTTVEQKYRVGTASDTFTVSRKATWNFDEGWAAPAAQPLVLSDYPPFQLLPLEVQQYFLRQFSEFETAEAWRVPDETAMEQNYPNPFNPETWIPYQLSEPVEVKLTIYAANGTVVRTLALGHQPAGLYQNRSRAAYWDGRNELGTQVTSGIYFYTFTADDFSATRKMVVAK